MLYFKGYSKLNMFEKIEEQEKQIENYKKAYADLLEWLQFIVDDPYTSNNAYSRVLNKVLEIMKKYE